MPTDSKIFLGAPIYTNFEWKRAPEEMQFFCQNFPKKAQKRFFYTLSFQKIAGGAEKLAKIRRGSRNFSNGADFKKIENFVDLFFVDQIDIRNNFFKIRPLEKILDPPLYI